MNNTKSDTKLKETIDQLVDSYAEQVKNIAGQTIKLSQDLTTATKENVSKIQDVTQEILDESLHAFDSIQETTAQKAEEILDRTKIKTERWSGIIDKAAKLGQKINKRFGSEFQKNKKETYSQIVDDVEKLTNKVEEKIQDVVQEVSSNEKFKQSVDTFKSLATELKSIFQPYNEEETVDAQTVEEISKLDKKSKSDKLPKSGDDLMVIKGLGPKSLEVLHEVGIKKYNQLASLSVRELGTILESAGMKAGRFNLKDWIAQARRLS